MKTYRFNKEKYNNGLLMESGKIENISNFNLSEEVHCTDFFEILIFQKGNGFVYLDTQKIELRDGVFLFISPFQKRRWFVDAKKIKGYFLVFEQDFLNDFFSDKLFVYRMQYFFNNSIKNFFIPQKRLFLFGEDIFKEMFYEITNTQKDSPHLLRSILYYILIKLNREFCVYHHLENDTQLSTSAFLFKEALEKNIREKQQVNEYAQLLGISRIALNKNIKRQFNKTVSDMIKERLLDEIKDELLFSDKTISEIAYELNFSEAHHLNRFFKRQLHQTPRTYRLAYQNGYI